MTGYGLARELAKRRVECVVAAPSKIPRGSGARVKTDRRAQPDRGERVDPAQAAQPADLHAPRRAGQQREDLALKGLAAMGEHVDRALGILERRLRRRREHDLIQPAAVPIVPHITVLEADPAAQQQLGEPVPAAHQILAQRLPGADQIAQRLLLVTRHPHRVQLAGQQQPGQQLRVACEPFGGSAYISLTRVAHSIAGPPPTQPTTAASLLPDQAKAGNS